MELPKEIKGSEIFSKEEKIKLSEIYKKLPREEKLKFMKDYEEVISIVKEEAKKEVLITSEHIKKIILRRELAIMYHFGVELVKDIFLSFDTHVEERFKSLCFIYGIIEYENYYERLIINKEEDMNQIERETRERVKRIRHWLIESAKSNEQEIDNTEWYVDCYFKIGGRYALSYQAIFEGLRNKGFEQRFIEEFPYYLFTNGLTIVSDFIPRSYEIIKKDNQESINLIIKLWGDMLYRLI